MELKTERLCLRPITRKDLRAVLAYACDLSNAEYMVYYPKTEQEAVSYVEETASQWEEEEPITYEFAVLLDGEMIGTVSLWLEEADGVEIGWILNRHYWGCGYGTEADRHIPVQLLPPLINPGSLQDPFHSQFLHHPCGSYISGITARDTGRNPQLF